jgi:hypothetical protein
VAKKNKHKQRPREDQAPPGAAPLEAGAGPPPTMKRKQYPQACVITAALDAAPAPAGARQYGMTRNGE